MTKKQFRQFIFLAAGCFCIFLLSGCAKEKKNPLLTAGGTIAGQLSLDKAFTCMETLPEISLMQVSEEGAVPLVYSSLDLLHTQVALYLYDKPDAALLRDCFTLIMQYEYLLSASIDSSEVSKRNNAEGTEAKVGTVTAGLIKESLKYGELTEGAFDITIAPVSKLWDFTSAAHTGTVPSAQKLEKALPLVGYQKVSVDEKLISFETEKMQLELGAIAKGFIADRVKNYLRSKGVQSAIIDLGGNILTIGNKPDGTPFRIGIQKPFEDRNKEIVAVSEVSDASVVSSGIYERYFYDASGNFYHHLLNPATGYPVENELLQVTIYSKSSMEGDALSTGCFVLGLTKGMELINRLDDVYAVFMTKDGTLYFSEGLEEAFSTERCQ